MIKELKSLKNYVDKNNKEYSKYIDKVIKTAAKKKKALYTAAFLTPASAEELANWWASTVKDDLLDKRFMHHMTIKFRPDAEEVIALPIDGSEVELQVVGYASDDKGQAVLVSGVESSNDNPHITVSTAEGVSPVYSNELLSSGLVEEVATGPVLKVKIGFWNGKEARYDFDNSIYED